MGDERYKGLDSELVEKLKAFELAADKMQATVEPLSKVTRKTLKKFGPFTRAKLSLATAYAAVGLYVMRMRAQGQSLSSTHPVSLTLARVKEYFEKIQSAVPEAKRVKESQAARLLERRKTTVDKEAAGRLIQKEVSANRVILQKQAASAAAAAAAAAGGAGAGGEEEEVEEIEEIEEVEEVEEEGEDADVAAVLASAIGDDSAPSSSTRKRGADASSASDVPSAKRART